MALKGYIDRQAGRDRLKTQMLKQHGDDFVPIGGWDAFFGPDDPVCDVRCQKCGRMVPEVRPFGEGFKQICEDCASKDMAMTERMSQGAI